MATDMIAKNLSTIDHSYLAPLFRNESLMENLSYKMLHLHENDPVSGIHFYMNS